MKFPLRPVHAHLLVLTLACFCVTEHGNQTLRPEESCVNYLCCSPSPIIHSDPTEHLSLKITERRKIHTVYALAPTPALQPTKHSLGNAMHHRLLLQ